MRLHKLFLNKILVCIVLAGIAITSCQKLYRPPLNIIPDPPPPPYDSLKTLWSFDGSVTDSGEDSLVGTATNISYTTGINGQAYQGSTNGYVLVDNPGDTIRNLGAFTIAFWMNTTGPISGGARGLFSISHSSQFWGNLDIFIDNFGDDATTSLMKVHMFNSNYNADAGQSEEWTEFKLPDVYGKWSHIAITYDSSTSVLQVYKDGDSAFTKTIKDGKYGPIAFSDVKGLVLGSWQFQTSPSQTSGGGAQDWAKGFDGALDQFRIYNKPLTATEIKSLYTNKQ